MSVGAIIAISFAVLVGVGALLFAWRLVNKMQPDRQGADETRPPPPSGS
ncbi:MAG: hypothetical protein O7H39_07000 [Gammaproteobacteria bacterium]|nr:hypothetical protein [Gammaproteobacteria bacterium]